MTEESKLYVILAAYIALLTVLFNLFLCLFTLPIYQLIKILRDKINKNNSWLTNKRIKYIIAFVSVSFSFFVIYRLHYPSDSFFIDLFENETKLTFPSSSKFIHKSIWFPTIQGEQVNSSDAIAKLSYSDYMHVLYEVTINKTFHLCNSDTTVIESIERMPSADSASRYIFKSNSKVYINKTFLKNHLLITFYDKDTTIKIYNDSE